MFKGSIVAIITPFTQKNTLNESALEHLVEWHISQGTDGIVCCGTTGEGPALTDDEKVRVMEICVNVSSRRIPIIAGTGTNDTEHSRELSKKAKQIGVDGCLVVVPYYNRPSQLGCLAHFSEIGKVGLPIVAYHHPKRTGTQLLFETFAALGKIPNIVAIKEASGSLEFVKNIRRYTSLPILSGEDTLTCAIINEGGTGVISIVANIFPAQWKQMVTKALEGNFSEAEKIQMDFLPLCNALNIETNPQGIKYAASILGKCFPFVRLPMLLPPKIVQDKIQKEIKHLVEESHFSSV